MDLNELLDDAMQSGMLTPDMYQYYKGLARNRIIINEDISYNLIELAVIPLIDMDNDPNVKEIEIIINSGGGSVYTGFSLIDVIENLKTPTTIRITGMAASMAMLISMAGHNNDCVTTVCNKHAVGLIHSGSQYVEGSTHAVRDTFKFSERYEEKVKDYILNHTTIDEEMYKEIERQEFWMTSDDMLKYGIVQKVV